MRDDFAIFILTHERASQQKTYKTLRKSGYTGKIYLVVDNLDRQIEEYKQKYGDDVLVFDKNAEYEKTDTFTNRKELKAVVYARNKVFDLAKEKNLIYFCSCDDDINVLKYKFPIDGKLKTVKVKNADKLFDSVCSFIEKTNFLCLSFLEEGAFVGGINQFVLKGLQWRMSHFMFYRTKEKITYRGLWYEDTIASIDLMKQGKLGMGTMLVSVAVPETGSNEGGMYDAYKSSNEWIAAFGVIMANPDCVAITCGKKIKLQRSGEIASPKIISDKWRKEVEL